MVDAFPLAAAQGNLLSGGALSLMGLPVIPKDIPPSYKDAAIANGQDLVGWVYAATILSGLTTVFHV